MNMKRYSLLILVLLGISVTAMAGVRLNLDSGNISGIPSLVEASESNPAEETESELDISIMGGGGTFEEPLLFSSVLILSQDGVQTLKTVTLDASGSLPGAGEIILYEWDLNGDGIFDESSIESTIEHSYVEDDVISLQLRVTNDSGESSVSDVLTLTVVNQQPVAEFSAEFGDDPKGTLVQFVDSSYDYDGTIASWIWSFGDGHTSNDLNPYHVYDASGNYTVTLSVIDNDHAQSESYVFNVEILNAAPQAGFSLQQATASAGSPLTFFDESVDSDSDGGIIHVAWDFGDGAYQAGSPSANSEYSHTFAVAGIYFVTLYVIDDDGALGRTQLPITIL